MNAELIKQLENMSEEEIQAIMSAEIPEELEKQAAAELAEAELIAALRTYGALTAERAVAEVASEGDLSKVASAEEIEAHAQAEAELGALIEEALNSLSIAENENEIALHKTAQACAAVIFEGYTGALENLVDASAELAPAVEKLAHAAIEKASAQESVAPLLDKTASEMTVGEIYGALHGISEIEAGVEKLASVGFEKAAKMKEIMEGAKKGVKEYIKSIRTHADNAINGNLIGVSGKERAMEGAKALGKGGAPIAALAAGGMLLKKKKKSEK